ncbi:MAG: NAD(P)H-dependent oxidoreductase subunit E, partial [Cyclobacteriaceae bacterium]|nr:NAD(P)H-dependent oxidoreductase subunit E [Cyclobacteriaceae bacterium]
MSKNLSELSGRKGISENLFDKMGELAKAEGSPSSEDLDKLAKEFLIGTANTYGTASFYDFLKPDNKGKRVYICNGTACFCAGTQQHVEKTLKARFKKEEIGHMTCLGRCHENSAFHLEGKNYSGKAIDHLDELAKSESNRDTYHVKSGTYKV